MQRYKGERGKNFKQVLFKVLSTGLNVSELNNLLTEDALMLYSTAFTSKAFNPNVNYEMYEQLGDVTIGKFIVNYMYRRFPQLQTPDGVDIIAKLKIKYASKEQLQKISDSLQFWNFISSSQEERETEKDKKKLLEDVFEAFIGCTEFLVDDYVAKGNKLNNYGGIGYNVCYFILRSIFDKIKISLKYEDLVDAKTRLNELMTKLEGEVKYNTKVDKEANTQATTIIWYTSREPILLAKEDALTKKESEEKAASAALFKLEKEYGIIKEPPAKFKFFK